MPVQVKDPHRRHQWSFSSWFGLASVVLLLALQLLVLRQPTPRTVRYDELIELARGGRLAEVELRSGELRARLVPNDKGVQESVRASRLPGVDERPLVEELEARHVHIIGHIEESSPWSSLFFNWILPIGVLSLIYRWGLGRLGKSGGALSFGKSRAKIYDAAAASPVTFADVAGVDEAVGELGEVVQFLKQPERYRALGAHIPKGVLLVGPPGTGKTLLARAVAGEAKVPFFSITGSEFVEMFVGVGASRVRDLFEQAKERAPCLVFIDEIDAIGRARGGLGVMATNDEREQTLNQLLAEMDGFSPNGGVILMAATNRPEVLDQALLRAGRFDRQVLVDRPDIRGREAILRVHAKRAKIADVSLTLVAQRTSGMVGADLANVVNEAALAAARRSSATVEQRDFEEAVDRLQLGLKKQGRVMNPQEKRRVAHHEAGHALVALSVAHADPVERVTIIPRSTGALGATLQLPTEDRYLMTRDELQDRLCVMMGGRAAEELALGDVSTGAQDDLERATATARHMVCHFGMSSGLGARTYGPAPGGHLLQGVPDFAPRDFSDETASAIDVEVRELVEAALRRARAYLERNLVLLDVVAQRLLVVETLDRHELEALTVGVMPHESAA